MLLALVGYRYEIVIANSTPHTLLAIYHLISSAHRIIFKYHNTQNITTHMFLLLRLNTVSTNGQYIAAGQQGTGKVSIWNITESQNHVTLQVFQGSFVFYFVNDYI